MRILVCGGRDFANPKPYDNSPENAKARQEYQFVHSTLNMFSRNWSKNFNPYYNWLPTDLTIITGGAKGVDSAAIDWATINFAQYEVYKPDWNTHGKAAGPIRNQWMLDNTEPDLVFAFPGGKGTADMVNRAHKAGVTILGAEYKGE